MHWVALRCSVLQCIAVYCIVLQCIAVYVDDCLEGEAFDAMSSREDLGQLKFSKVSFVVMSCITSSSELIF